MDKKKQLYVHYRDHYQANTDITTLYGSLPGQYRHYNTVGIITRPHNTVGINTDITTL